MTAFGNVSLPQRFWSKVQMTESCWLWVGAIKENGYGRFRFDGRAQHAHRVAYQAMRGEVPSELELDHLCRNRRCVNPDHLEAVTHRENDLRGVGVSAIHARATACPKGHPYDADNTYITRRGGRACRACHRASETRRHRSRRAEVTA